MTFSLAFGAFSDDNPVFAGLGRAGWIILTSLVDSTSICTDGVSVW